MEDRQKENFSSLSPEKQEADSLLSYLKMGVAGHFPLFHQDWLKESLSTSSKKLTLREARKNCEHHFLYLSSFKKLDKQISFLESYQVCDRQKLISSFLKIVESMAIQQYEKLH